MTHCKHAAALLTAVLLLALTACGRQTAAASDPAQTPAAPVVETPVIAAPAATPTPAAGKDAGSDGWKAKFERSLLEDYGVTPDHYVDLGNGIYQVYVKIDGKVVPTSRSIPRPATTTAEHRQQNKNHAPARHSGAQGRGGFLPATYPRRPTASSTASTRSDACTGQPPLTFWQPAESSRSRAPAVKNMHLPS